MAKMLIFLWAILIVLGLLLLLFQKTQFLGKLPGDILIERKNFTFYFPLATSIIISIIVSLILYLIGKFR